MVISALASTAVHMIFEAQPRYHYAFVPLLAMLAALGIARAAYTLFGNTSPQQAG